MENKENVNGCQSLNDGDISRMMGEFGLMEVTEGLNMCQSEMRQR